VEEINDAIEDESVRRRTAKQNPKLVAQETRPLKTLSHSDAMIKLVLSQDLFLVFKNEESGKLEVIYRRNDGNFGVIKPE
jgi:putative sigma-54 modulation protein